MCFLVVINTSARGAFTHYFFRRSFVINIATTRCSCLYFFRCMDVYICATGYFHNHIFCSLNRRLFIELPLLAFAAWLSVFPETRIDSIMQYIVLKLTKFNIFEFQFLKEKNSKSIVNAHFFYEFLSIL